MRIFLFALPLLLAAPVHAGEADWTARFDVCQADITSLDEMASCIGSYTEACSEERIRANQDLADGACMAGEAALWDAKLNRTWGAVKERLASDPAGMEALRGAQKAWIGFRDAECAAMAAIWADNGTGAAEAATCQMRLTAERVITLQSLVEGND
jgi:uncharacterized protein YecT (DUF1311 family)